MGKKTRKLTGRNARADVHGGDLDLRAKVAALERGGGGGGSTCSWCGGGGGTLCCSSTRAGSGLLVVVDDDTDARSALTTSSELHLGSLDESSLGVLQGTVEAVLALCDAWCLSFVSGRDFLAHALEGSDLVGLDQ